MGFDFTRNATKDDIVRLITTRVLDFQYTRQILRHHLTEEQHEMVLWTVEEFAYHTLLEKKRFIGCYLLQPSSYGWGYKMMFESIHPYFYSCPVEYLDMVPVACQEWRERTLAFHRGGT